jgi:hypothetical protein
VKQDLDLDLDFGRRLETVQSDLRMRGSTETRYSPPLRASSGFGINVLAIEVALSFLVSGALDFVGLFLNPKS